MCFVFQPPLPPWAGELPSVPAVDECMRSSSRTWEEVNAWLQRPIQRHTIQANRYLRTVPPLRPGQMVWLLTEDLKLKLLCKKQFFALVPDLSAHSKYWDN